MFECDYDLLDEWTREHLREPEHVCAFLVGYLGSVGQSESETRLREIIRYAYQMAHWADRCAAEKREEGRVAV